MQRTRPLYACVCVFLCLAWGTPPNVEARTMLLDNPQRVAFSGFGAALATIDDVDADQVSDYLVGAYDNRWEKNDRQGRAFV